MVLQITGIPSCLPWCKNKKNMFFKFQRQQNRLHYSFYIILTLLSQVPTLTQPCFGSTLFRNVKNVLFFLFAQNALERRGDVKIEVCAILNDTTGCLMR
jgi:hypothetical protein